MKNVLMVAEKPSIADSVAHTLSGGKKTSRKGVAFNVHEWTGRFQNGPANFRMTSVAGHVYSVDFVGKYNDWTAFEPDILFEAEIVKKESNPKTRVVKHLSSEAKGCSNLVLWLDCDREGENICYEVIGVCDFKKEDIYRAHFSSLAPKDISQAFQNLGYPNENESKSVDARQEIDLKIGCSFTRYQTAFFKKYGNLESTLISYGPCQIPTLHFCVERYDQIAKFEPEDFWSLSLALQGVQDSDITWDRSRLFSELAVNVFRSIILGGSTAKVVKVSKKALEMPKPLPLNTVAMLKNASAKLGIGPQQAMQGAERLYLSGFITYPRTETSRYAPNFDFTSPLQSLSSGGSQIGSYAANLLKGEMKHPRKDGEDAGDHPPITPVRFATEADVGYDLYRLYEMITKNFLASISGNCKFEKTTVTFDASGENFSLSGRKVLNPGFLEITKEGGMNDVRMSKDFKEGEILVINECRISRGTTSPPGFLSESELLTLMEKHGIGTDASMATHINNICERSYVKLIEGRKLRPTKLGLCLIHGYYRIDPELVLPTVRATIENQCNLIAKGKADSKQVVAHSLTEFRKKFHYFVENISVMDTLFDSSFVTVAESGSSFTKCGICRRYMNYLKKEPQRLFCIFCNSAYDLPKGGVTKSYMEKTCPLDGFQLVVHSKDGVMTPLCPMCYNNPPFPTARKTITCLQCEHPTCKHGKAQLSVTTCPQESCPGSGEGVVCLDPTSAPQWKLQCNSCKYMIRFKENIHNIAVGALCPKCEICKQVEIEFHIKSKESGQQISGCLTCDETIHSLLEAAISRRNRPGRGRGRGGRRKQIDPRLSYDRF
eukprot:GHVP01042382.1.p1 GENE.GHVP01042382.1~~GHVP01042382.1.p1  ORF type:complete len:833 (+),score=121.93 GHVP01042382.1:640-3138(+)